MYSSPKNQIVHATKSLFEMQVDVANKLGMKNLEGLSNLMNLNVHAMHVSLNNSMDRMHALLSSKNSLEFFSKMATQAQPSASQLISYGNDVAEIAAGIRDEYFKATQVEVSEAGKEMSSILGQMVDHESNSFNNMIQMTKATIKETEEKVEQAAHSTELVAEQAVEHAAEKAIKTRKVAAKTSKAAVKTPKANHKAATHHQVAQRKKHVSAASKKANGHRKAAHH
jgi:phasin family protein